MALLFGNGPDNSEESQQTVTAVRRLQNLLAAVQVQKDIGGVLGEIRLLLYEHPELETLVPAHIKRPRLIVDNC